MCIPVDKTVGSSHRRTLVPLATHAPLGMDFLVLAYAIPKDGMG